MAKRERDSDKPNMLQEYATKELQLTELMGFSQSMGTIEYNVTKEIEESHAQGSSWSVNVGGEVFSLPLRLIQSSSDKFNFLRQLVDFSDLKLNLLVKDENTGQDIPFIDRDPNTFRHILNYLRGYSYFYKLEEEEKNKLKVDAEYYGLTGLKEMLQPEKANTLFFCPGPGVSVDQLRQRITYSVVTIGDSFLVTGKHKIMFQVLCADYVGVGLVSDSCLNRDQEHHKSLNSCVYYMSGVFYSNFPQHRKDEGLEKYEDNSYIAIELDMDKGTIEFILKNSSKIIYIGPRMRLKFAVTMKLNSKVRIVPKEEAANVKLYSVPVLHAA